MAAEPLDISPTATSHGPLAVSVRWVTRLIKFFRDWGVDITQGARRLFRIGA
jgi:hypothetical protein